MNKNTASAIKSITAIYPQSIASATATPVTIDKLNASGFSERAVFVVSTGVFTGGTSSCVAKVQHCDTAGGSYADLLGQETGTAITATITSANTTVELDVDLTRANRYLQLSLVNTLGTASAILVSAVALMGQNTVEPV